MSGSGAPATWSASENAASGLRVAVIAARYNGAITDELVEGAKRALLAYGAAPDAIQTIRVPGSWELPQVAARVAATRRFDAIVALGCVIRGETPHFEYVSMEASLGLGAVARDSGVPLAFGVLTTNDVAQARARAGRGDDNKGYEAVMAALELVAVYRALGAG